MDAATLRLILIVVGAAFLIGMYLWERGRAAQRDEEPGWDDYLGNARADKREPNLGPLDADEHDQQLSDAAGIVAGAASSHSANGPTSPTVAANAGSSRASAPASVDADEMGSVGEVRPMPPNGLKAATDQGQSDAVQDLADRADEPGHAALHPGPGETEPRVAPDLDVNAQDAPSAGETDRIDAGQTRTTDSETPALASAAATKPLLIQLYVVATGRAFAGAHILAAAKRQKLVPGSMNIFHRLASDNSAREPLYSMANLVKPGSFPLQQMHTFESPGLALFTQLDGDPSDLMVYDELLHTARALADELGGEVQERGRRPLTPGRARELRGQVLALLQLGSDPP